MSDKNRSLTPVNFFLITDAKREVRELNRTQETLLLEYREELDAAHRQQRKQLSGLEEEVKMLRVELRSRDEKLERTTEQCDELDDRYNQAKQHASQLQKRYERVEAENEALVRRLRDMEQQQERKSSASTAQSYQEINHSLRQELKQTKQSLLNAEDKVSEQAAEIKQLQLDLRTATAQPADNPHLQQQLTLAQQTITSQNDEFHTLKQQLRDKQDKLSQQTATLTQHKRLIEAKLDRLQSDCQQVSAVLSTHHSSVNSLTTGRLPSWLPRSVVLLIDEFRSSTVPAADDRLSLFVLALNKIWKERVDERGKRVREQCEAEIAELKRRLEQRLPYELVTQKARIVRLQRELDESRRRYLKRQRGGGGVGGAGGNGGAKDLLDLSLSTVENLSKQVTTHTATNNLQHSLMTSRSICVQQSTHLWLSVSCLRMCSCWRWNVRTMLSNASSTAVV